MFGAEIDLGSSLHIHPKHKLRLAVTASARVSFPGPDALFLSSLTLPEIFTSRDTWVSLGPGLKLTVEVYLSGTLHGSGDVNLALTEIGQILEHADFWSTLGLTTSRKDLEPMLGYQDAGRLVYTIQPEFNVRQDKEAKCPTKQVPDVNVHPPEGIPAAILQEIKVSFRFEPVISLSKPSTHPRIKQRDEGFDDLLFELDDFDPNQLGAIAIQGAFQPEITRCQDAVFQFPVSVGGYGEYLEYDGPFSSQDTQSSRPLLCQNEEKSENTMGSVDIEPFTMLIDSGFRGLICDKPIRTAAGIKTHFEEPRIKLADTAPAIFSPRYLSSMSQRAGYIPMIAKSISTMLERTNSMRLKAKTKLLEEAYRTRTGVVYDGTTGKPNTRTSLKCLLWMSLQRGVFDPGAARRLPRLHTSRGEKRQQILEAEPDLPFPSKTVDSNPIIDILDEPPFDPDIHPGHPSNEDPNDELLFSELGLQETDHDSDLLEDNLPFHRDFYIEDDFFNYFDSSPIPLSPIQNTPYNNIDLDCDLLEIPTTPAQPPRSDLNSPTLPIPMDVIPSSPLLSPTIHTDPIILPDSDLQVPPSSPPLLNPVENQKHSSIIHEQHSDDMLLS